MNVNKKIFSKIKNAFTLIEILIVISILGFITGFITINYSIFTSKSALGIEIFNILEFVSFAQSTSLASISTANQTNIDDKSYTSVRIRVRNTKLIDYRLEYFSSTVTNNNLKSRKAENSLKQADIPKHLRYVYYFDEVLTPNDLFWDSGNIPDVDKKRSSNDLIVRYCFLVNEIRTVNSEKKTTLPSGDYLCEVGLKESINTLLEEKYKITKYPNNFDLHISFEYPTQEAAVSVLPLIQSAFATCDGNRGKKDELNTTLCYDNSTPRDRFFNEYKPFQTTTDKDKPIGLRIFLEDKEGNYRYFDILESGLIALDSIL